MPGLATQLPASKTLQQEVADHELRIRALEKWAAWIGGGIGMITMIGQLILTVIKAVQH